MKRFYAFAALCAVGACTPDSSKKDGSVGDLAASNEDGGHDLSVPDSGNFDGSNDADPHQPLKLPVDAVPLTTDGGVDHYELHAKEATAQVLPGAPTTIWGFNGLWPGPTIHATLGRPVTVRVFNDLPVDESLTIHNHGHNVLAPFDGHPSNNTIPKGSSYQYQYPNMQAGGTPPNIQGAATYFYHDHMVDLTAPHFYKGLEAFYIIHPAPGSAEAALNLPSGAYDIPLMIQDRIFNADNSLNYDINIITGFQGNTLLVNGTVHPYLSVARRKYRFRLLNASNSRRIDVGLSAGQMNQISTDGGLLSTYLVPSRIPLAPAERSDIVIDFAKYKIGDVVTMTNDDPFQPEQPEIIQFRVDRDEADTSALPGTLNSTFTRYTAASPPVTRNRSLTFAYDNAGGNWHINGQTYVASAIEFNDTQLGDVEIWSLINSDGAHQIPHPFHQHLVEFQIIDVCPLATPACGTQPIGPQSGWKDTVLVQPGTIVRIKMQFYYNGPEPTHSVFPGDYVFHCHNLEHEDHAMMLQQLISPSPSPNP